MIPPVIPEITDNDRLAVSNQLRSGYVNDGKTVVELEGEISDYHGAFCVCMSSCTVALEVIMRYYGVCEITVPMVSQISTIHSLINAGVEKIECSDAPLLQADLSGRVAEGGMFSDAAQSILTKGIVDGRMACAFSLGALKSITGGVGGGILTVDRQLWIHAKEVKQYGKSMTAINDTDISRVGSNYRMSDINAALALSQWRDRDRIICKKWHIYDLYRKALGDAVWERDGNEVPWVVEATVGKWPEKDVFRPYYSPFGCYTHLATKISNWGEARGGVTAVMLPSSTSLTDNEIEEYAETFKKEYL